MSRQTLEVAGLKAAPGEKRVGWLAIAETPVQEVRVPIGIMNGRGEGPSVCVTGGVHGSEYPGITAVGEVFRDLHPDNVKGAVVVVPVVNTLAFERRAGFVVPVDNLNPNRVAPGRSDGSMAEVLIYKLIEEVITKCNYHIDCHGGDLPEALSPHAIFTRTGRPEVDSVADAMARVYDTPYIVPTGEGSLLPFPKGTVHEEVARRGIPSIVGEIGGAGSLYRDEVEGHIHGIRNVLQLLKIIDGIPKITVKQWYAKTKFFVYTRRGGLLHLLVRMDEMIDEGQPVAEVRDVFGELREVVRSPQRGLVRFIMTHRAVNTGDPVLNCWTLEPVPPNPLSDALVDIGRMASNPR